VAGVSGPPEPTDAGGPLVDADPSGSLAGRSARSGAVLFVAQGLQFVVAVGATAVLARLLTPGDYGLFFMVGLLLGLVNSFRDFGFPMATVQAARLELAALSSLFWLNARLNAALAGAMVLIGPLLAWYYGEPRLTAAVWVLSLAVACHGLASIHLGLLRRQMRFGTLAAANVGANLAGWSVALLAAWAGAGFWALVLHPVVLMSGEALLLWGALRWRPLLRPGATGEQYQALRRFGRDAAVARVVGHAGQNTDVLLVGRLFGASALGLYQNAFRWATVLFEQVHYPLQQVVVTALSRLQGEPDRYCHYLRSALRAVTVVLFGVLALLFVEADTVIGLLLGPQWEEAVPLFRILVVGAAAQSVNHLLKWVFYAEGRPDRQRRWALATAPVLVAAVAVGTIGGTRGVAWGYTAASVALAYPAVRFALSTSPLPRRDFWAVLARPAVASLVGAGAVALLRLSGASPGPLALQLVLHGAVFVVAAAACWLATPQGRVESAALVATVALLRPQGPAPAEPLAGPGG
jgi:O-antigen/teichoic acid export membrane protein